MGRTTIGATNVPNVAFLYQPTSAWVVRPIERSSSTAWISCDLTDGIKKLEFIAAAHLKFEQKKKKKLSETSSKWIPSPI